MVDIGHFALVFAWALSVFAIVAGVISAKRKIVSLSLAAERSLLLVTVFSLISYGFLTAAFVLHDYNNVYVWRTSNNDMDTKYLFSAVWGGMDGSILLWVVIMSIFIGLFMRKASQIPRDLRFWLIPILAGAEQFFLIVATFLTNPFRTMPAGVVHTDGNGLNPLLQNPSMMIHPPCLYSGFTGMVIPAGLCLAALCSGNLSETWIRLSRKWTLIAWAFLSTGIVLGGNWAYIELGWGGFWAWDPVENASFLPWLSATAFLHSVMAQERRGMLKVWNASLAVLTYVLTVFGTFLTRSGVVQSVHAFAETDIGWVFLVYIGGVVLLTAALILYRLRELKPDNTFRSFYSREAGFLFNSLVLLGICFATFWGVMFPVLSEAVTGQKSVVGPPFFSQVNGPLFLLLLFLMGSGPLLSWRQTSKEQLKRNFILPFVFGSIVVLLGLFIEPSRVMSSISFGLVVFVLTTVIQEFHRGVGLRRIAKPAESVPASLGALFQQKSRRYGGLLIHAGVAVMAFSITTSLAYKIERDLTLHLNEKVSIGRFTIELASLNELKKENYNAIQAKLNVYGRDGTTYIGELKPERRFYPRNEEVTTEVDIRMSLIDDLYVALSGMESPDKQENANTAVFLKVFVNPFQIWLWFGGIIMLLGTLVVLAPRVPQLAVEEVPQELPVRV